jgi:hypothetical protein
MWKAVSGEQMEMVSVRDLPVQTVQNSPSDCTRSGTFFAEKYMRGSQLMFYQKSKSK